MEVPHGHPVLAWLVQHAAGCINRGLLGPDGETAYFRWKGRPFKRSLLPFGEMVEFLPAGKRQTSTIGDRWPAGIYLGVVEKSSELIIGFGEKVVKARCVRHRTMSERSNSEALLKIQGLP